MSTTSLDTDEVHDYKVLDALLNTAKENHAIASRRYNRPILSEVNRTGIQYAYDEVDSIVVNDKRTEVFRMGKATKDYISLMAFNTEHHEFIDTILWGFRAAVKSLDV